MPDLHLALVAHPRVEYRLGLGGKSSLLLELESLSLKLSGFLYIVLAKQITNGIHALSHPRNSEKVLGNVNNTAETPDVVDPLLDGVGVLGPGGVQDALNLVGVAVGPLLVHGSSVVSDGPEDAEERDHDNGLLVDNVDLVADRGNGQTGTGGQDRRLGGKAAAGQRVQNGLCPRLGVRGGDIGGTASTGQRSRDGRESSRDERWSEAGGAWRDMVSGCVYGQLALLHTKGAFRNSCSHDLGVERARCVDCLQTRIEVEHSHCSELPRSCASPVWVLIRLNLEIPMFSLYKIYGSKLPI